MRKTKQVTFRLTDEQYKKCVKYCDRMKEYGIEVSVATIIRWAIDKFDLSLYEKFKAFRDRVA